ncbi:DUF1876 domain-containing protein [Actinopolymorpha sp. B17G11]|uniref:DUF1876 domain-containing protein n=1 Tax=unclassified Actinopolymorpha TaxID=2627063 RepID=UPI0032D9001B
MTATKTWTVEISIDEHENRTRAVARLVTNGTARTGKGTARLNPSDRNVPMIGDELAAARALSELSHQLLHAAADDIESVTAEPAHLHY